MKLLKVQSPPLFRYLVHLRSDYSALHPNLEKLQPNFSSLSQTPFFSGVQSGTVTGCTPSNAVTPLSISFHRCAILIYHSFINDTTESQELTSSLNNMPLASPLPTLPTHLKAQSCKLVHT